MDLTNTCRLFLKIMAFGVLVIVLCDGHTDRQKRLPNLLHQFALKRLPREYFNRIIQQSLARSRERRGHLSDVGYGSRVSAGSNIASAIMARHGLFGITGPGRKKRLSTHDIVNDTARDRLDSKADSLR